MCKPTVHTRNLRLGAAEGLVCAHRHTQCYLQPSSLASIALPSRERGSHTGRACIFQQENRVEHTGESNQHSGLKRCGSNLALLSSLISRRQVQKENPGRAKRREPC